MGIPSPFVGVSPSPRSCSSSKHSTPEHSLLCGVEGVCIEVDDLLPAAAIDVSEGLRPSLPQELSRTAEERDEVEQQIDTLLSAMSAETPEVDTGAATFGLESLQIPAEAACGEAEVLGFGEAGSQFPATMVYTLPAPWLATGSYMNLSPSPERQARRPKWPFGSSPPFNRAPTTIEITGFPAELTQTKLISTFDVQGFYGLYDFVFLPMDEHGGENEGYALVNLVRHVHALALVDHLLEFTGCSVKWSFTLQGQDALVNCFREESWLNVDTPDEMRPQIFLCGMELPFPVSDKPARKPTRRRQAWPGK